ncbi:MAG: alkene reductase, partial [Chitinophagaceae bacterium]|nr:alkene reductase [Chitinophagaceae bacterium]
HIANLPEGGEIVAPSAIAAKGEMWTDAEGMQPHTVPKEMTAEDILKTQEEYVQAAKNAIEAGFDGIELHGANGYLLDQFINPGSNQRTDAYGGSIENRARFVIETAQKTAEAIGADKTGIRLSPHGAFNDLYPFEGVNEQYEYLAKELGKLNLVYLHIVDHSAMGAPVVPEQLKEKMKEAFAGTIIYSGGLTKESAEERLQKDDNGLASFGKPFLANPDLVSRFRDDVPLNHELKMELFYTPGAEGYTDYPFYSEN